MERLGIGKRMSLHLGEERKHRLEDTFIHEM